MKQGGGSVKVNILIIFFTQNAAKQKIRLTFILQNLRFLIKILHLSTFVEPAATCFKICRLGLTSWGILFTFSNSKIARVF